MKYLSTFSGIGGFELGIQQAYETIKNRKQESIRAGTIGEHMERQRDISNSNGEWLQPNEESGHRLLDGVCIGYSEIDKYASAIYQKHFPSHHNYGDITKINADELPDFDLLVGGFPCQAFSIAGKRGGFEDTRGTMFFELARILRAKQPRLCVFENVKGLLSHDGGKSFATIIQTLDELGYDCQWQVLNSKNHGVPQNRERVFIIGHLRGTRRPEVFPFGHNSQTTTELSGQHSNTLTTRYYGAQANGTYVLESELDAQTLRVAEATKQGYAVAHEGDSINLSVPNSKTRRGRVGKGVAQTLDTGMQQHTLQNAQIRRLTPTECERLQGFPDGWTESISDTQRYKCLGNAVTVNVIKDIFERIL
jgi:DNA (cytosine-5)-methyltransferase 1